MSLEIEPPRKPYHHGDLAAAAVRKAIETLDAGDQLSMRALAQAIGVAHRALFNHFPDRAAFEAAVAAHGFNALADDLAAADQPAAFLRAYAGFGLARPALYDIMMRQPHHAFGRHDALRDAADRVIATALAVLAPDESDPDVGRRAVMRVWMLAHGGVGMQRAGLLLGRPDPDFIEELVRIADYGP
jgi:AcrR family transcriptional regulator